MHSCLPLYKMATLSSLTTRDISQSQSCSRRWSSHRNLYNSASFVETCKTEVACGCVSMWVTTGTPGTPGKSELCGEVVGGHVWLPSMSSSKKKSRGKAGSSPDPSAHSGQPSLLKVTDYLEKGSDVCDHAQCFPPALLLWKWQRWVVGGIPGTLKFTK